MFTFYLLFRCAQCSFIVDVVNISTYQNHTIRLQPAKCHPTNRLCCSQNREIFTLCMTTFEIVLLFSIEMKEHQLLWIRTRFLRNQREKIDGKYQNVGHDFPFWDCCFDWYCVLHRTVHVYYFGLLEIIFVINFIATTGVVIPIASS